MLNTYSKLRVARIRVSRNFAIYEGLKLVFRQHKLTEKGHIKQCAIMLVTSMYNRDLQREGGVDTALNGWKGQTKRLTPMIE